MTMIEQKLNSTGFSANLSVKDVLGRHEKKDVNIGNFEVPETLKFSLETLATHL